MVQLGTGQLAPPTTGTIVSANLDHDFIHGPSPLRCFFSFLPIQSLRQRLLSQGICAPPPGGSEYTILARNTHFRVLQFFPAHLDKSSGKPDNSLMLFVSADEPRLLCILFTTHYCGFGRLNHFSNNRHIFKVKLQKEKGVSSNGERNRRR